MCADTVDRATRSRIMSKVRGHGNRSTERRLRGALIAAGVRNWEIAPDDVLGRPDFVFRKKHMAVFVDGCFWHGCPKCYRRPKSSRQYWEQKVGRNRARDRKVTSGLRHNGWSVLRFWEHELADSPSTCVRRIEQRLRCRR